MQTRYNHLRSISQAGGSTKGALTCGYLKTYPVPIPSLDEQREIADVFASLDRKEKVQHHKHAALSALFRTLLHELMTARIRVHNLDLPELEILSECGQPCPREPNGEREGEWKNQISLRGQGCPRSVQQMGHELGLDEAN